MLDDFLAFPTPLRNQPDRKVGGQDRVGRGVVQYSSARSALRAQYRGRNRLGRIFEEEATQVQVTMTPHTSWQLQYLFNLARLL